MGIFDNLSEIFHVINSIFKQYYDCGDFKKAKKNFVLKC